MECHKFVSKVVRYNKTIVSFSEGDMAICSPSTGNILGNIALGLPASGEQIVKSPGSLRGNNCIMTSLLTPMYHAVVRLQVLFP